LAFVENLQSVGGMNDEYLSILLKVVGIGFLAEITSLVCADAVNATLGKVLQILASCVILWLSLPLLNGLIELVQDILGEI
jgi:stage III sporulation protein AD